jgi:hypothetical protein
MNSKRLNCSLFIAKTPTIGVMKTQAIHTDTNFKNDCDESIAKKKAY